MSVSEMSETLKKLREPFPARDIEWRSIRCGLNKKGEPWCQVFAYITARAIANRLDDTVGHENWCNTPLQVHEVRTGIWAMQVGISIRIGGEWVTKYDVSESTDIEPAKGGFSGAMKRAGAQWGIGRYLYLLEETYATEISDTRSKGWEQARLPDKNGGDYIYWKPPQLPGWALPREKEHEVSKDELSRLKKAWKAKLAPNIEDPTDLKDGFERFVVAEVGGEFPLHDHTCWSQNSLKKCFKTINDTKDPKGPHPSVPFE